MTLCALYDYVIKTHNFTIEFVETKLHVGFYTYTYSKNHLS